MSLKPLQAPVPLQSTQSLYKLSAVWGNATLSGFGGRDSGDLAWLGTSYYCSVIEPGRKHLFRQCPRHNVEEKFCQSWKISILIYLD